QFCPRRAANPLGEVALRNVQVYHALRYDRWLEKQSLTFLRSHQIRHVRRNSRKAFAGLLLLRRLRTTRLSFESCTRVCTENRPLNKCHNYKSKQKNKVKLQTKTQANLR